MYPDLGIALPIPTSPVFATRIASAAFVVVCTSSHSVDVDRFGQVQSQGDGKQLTASTYRVKAYDVSGGTSNNIDGLQVICMGDLA